MSGKLKEPDSADWEGHWFDPVAFAEKWYMDHPEVLDKFLKSSEMLDKVRKDRSKNGEDST